jgi:hypothetical protein
MRPSKGEIGGLRGFHLVCERDDRHGVVHAGKVEFYDPGPNALELRSGARGVKELLVDRAASGSRGDLMWSG